MDFRILDLDGHQILLERIKDDGRWQVIMSVYINLLDRFDEWETYADLSIARTFIADYPDEKARDFLERAIAWRHWKSEQAGETLLVTG